MKSSLPIIYFYQSNPKIRYIKHTPSNDITVKTIAQSLSLKSHHIRFKIHIQDSEPKMYAWFDISNPNAKSPIINDTIYVKILELKDPNNSKITKKLFETTNGQQVQTINTETQLQKDQQSKNYQQQQQLQPQQLQPQSQSQLDFKQVIEPQSIQKEKEKVLKEGKNDSPVRIDKQKPIDQQQEQQLTTDQQSFWNSFQQFPQQQEQQQQKQQQQQQQTKQPTMSVQSNDTVQSSNILEAFEEFDIQPKFTKSQPISQSDLEAEIQAQQQIIQQGKQVNLLGDFVDEGENQQVQLVVQKQHLSDQEIIDGRVQDKANQLKKQWDEEEQYNVLRQQAKEELEQKILKWAFRDNVRNNIRLLLTTLGDVLQDMGEWSCNIGDLMTESNLKRKYMAAIRIVHPDKFQMCDNYQHRYIAERVFYELNQAYNIKNGKN